MSIGERIKTAREKLGLTQNQLGELIETDGNTISRWERGIAEIKAEAVSKIATVLKTPVAYIMGEEDAIMLSWEGSDAVPFGPIFIPKNQNKSNAKKNTIAIETGEGENKKRYVLPETPEAYDFLKQLEKKNIPPEDQAILNLMEDMTQEEKKEMFDFLSKKESKKSVS